MRCRYRVSKSLIHVCSDCVPAPRTVRANHFAGKVRIVRCSRPVHACSRLEVTGHLLLCANVFQRRVVGRALQLWAAQWADEQDPYGSAFEILGVALPAWRGVAAELAEERRMMVKTRAADIFWRLRTWARVAIAWKAALRLLRRLHASEARIASRRRALALRFLFARFREAVGAEMEARAAEEARVARAGLRVWRAELRREKGGERQKRRVLASWWRLAREHRRAWPAAHRRSALLGQCVSAWSRGILVQGRHRLAKRLLERSGTVRAVSCWRQAASLQAHTRQGNVLAVARSRRGTLLRVSRQWSGMPVFKNALSLFSRSICRSLMTYVRTSEYARHRKAYYAAVIKASLCHSESLLRASLRDWRRSQPVQGAAAEVQSPQLPQTHTPTNTQTHAKSQRESQTHTQAQSEAPAKGLKDAAVAGDVAEVAESGQDVHIAAAAGVASAQPDVRGAQSGPSMARTASLRVLEEPVVSVGRCVCVCVRVLARAWWIWLFVQEAECE